MRKLLAAYVWLLAWLAISATIPSTAHAQSKSVVVPRRDADITILANGDVPFVETWQVQFRAEVAMPYRRTQFHQGGYYHLYNRGNNHQDVFFERENYLYFLRQIRKYLKTDVVEIIACCLMPNHYHLMLFLKGEGIAELVQPFLLSYTKAINERYNRVGSLFQGRFKAIRVDKEEYLLQLSRYIHLNPIVAGLVK